MANTYKGSKEQIDYLRAVMADGKKAEAIKEFADKYLGLTEKAFLDIAKNPKTKPEELVEYANKLRAANGFCGMITGKIKLAKQKEDEYNAILKK